jgi:hypothetical protein
MVPQWRDMLEKLEDIVAKLRELRNCSGIWVAKDRDMVNKLGG